MLTNLSDEELVSRLEAIRSEDRRLLARLLAHLAEVEERRLHLRTACSSLFDFCVRRLGMSEGAAFRRINGARLVRRFPCLLGSIERGEIHLSTLVLLRDHLTEANFDDLVAAASGKSEREVQQLLARHAPRPDVPATLRKLPASAASPGFWLCRCRFDVIAAIRRRGLGGPDGADRASLRRALQAAAHRQRCVPRQARTRERSHAPSQSERRSRSGGGARPGCVARQARSREARQDEARPARDSRGEAGSHGPCAARSSARGVSARWRPMHLRRRDGPAVSGADTPRARSRHLACARRVGRGREPPRVLQIAQRPSCRAGIRARAHRRRSSLSSAKVSARAARAGGVVVA
jgi:hypothetical protein